VGFAVKWVLALAGIGAAVLTRFGTREEAAVLPQV
jgi:hypothetical protein